MAKDLVFYTNPMSRGQIVRWALEETGASYETKIIPYGPEMKSDAYLAINPMGKVPALTHGETVVTETAAICAYLADAFADADLAPALADRGAYYRWLFFAAGPLESAILNKSLGVEVPTDKQAMAGYGTFETAIDTLEKAVSANDYIAGSKFTMADIYVGSHIGWGMQFGTIEKRDAFVEYWSRISERDARHRAVARDEALMPEEPA